jgi:hypothetical protein
MSSKMPKYIPFSEYEKSKKSLSKDLRAEIFEELRKLKEKNVLEAKEFEERKE